MTHLGQIRRVTGRPIPLRGNDIDTDRIMPSRFMKVVTFEGLDQHIFHDERFDQTGQSTGHPIDHPRYQAPGPRIAIINKNFGCGSSREHAPQALARWGIKALIGESFADIFFSNCVALGVPCVSANEETITRILEMVEEDPTHDVAVDLHSRTVTLGGRTFPVELPDSARHQLLEGTWDATRVLLQAADRIGATAEGLPYIRGF